MVIHASISVMNATGRAKASHDSKLIPAPPPNSLEGKHTQKIVLSSGGSCFVSVHLYLLFEPD